jgi:hypothetical protein
VQRDGRPRRELLDHVAGALLEEPAHGELSTEPPAAVKEWITAVVAVAGGTDAVAGYGTGARLEYLLIPLTGGALAFGMTEAIGRRQVSVSPLKTSKHLFPPLAGLCSTPPEIEAMLASQMAAVHMATMTFARRLNHVDNIPQQDSAERAFNKLARTFTTQLEASSGAAAASHQSWRCQPRAIEP